MVFSNFPNCSAIPALALISFLFSSHLNSRGQVFNIQLRPEAPAPRHSVKVFSDIEQY